MWKIIWKWHKRELTMSIGQADTCYPRMKIISDLLIYHYITQCSKHTKVKRHRWTHKAFKCKVQRDIAHERDRKRQQKQINTACCFHCLSVFKERCLQGGLLCLDTSSGGHLNQCLRRFWMEWPGCPYMGVTVFTWHQNELSSTSFNLLPSVEKEQLFPWQQQNEREVMTWRARGVSASVFMCVCVYGYRCRHTVFLCKLPDYRMLIWPLREKTGCIFPTDSAWTIT